MGQNECFNILREKKDWTTTKEILEVVDVHQSSVSESLQRLYKGGFIERKRDERRKHGYCYRAKK